MNIEELENKWNKFKKLVETLDASHPGALNFIEAYGTRLIECPASTEQNYFGAYPGGFLDLALNVTSKMRAMHKIFELRTPMEHVVFTGLFHAVGLMGDETRDLLVPQDSDWHIKRGIMYRHNESLPKMPVSHRSLYLLQTSGISMSLDEWTAIAISGGTHRDEAKFYAGAEPSLGLLLLHARQWVLGRAE
jgi:hypothetical protein